MQSVARQLLTALLVIHSNKLVHGHVSLSTVVLLDEQRAMLAWSYSLQSKNNWREFAAPEVLQ